MAWVSDTVKEDLRVSVDVTHWESSAQLESRKWVVVPLSFVSLNSGE